MKNIATLPTGKDYYISESELRLQLAVSEKKSLTIMAPDSLLFATIHNGNLEGWVLLPEANYHPVAFAYLGTALGPAPGNRWVTTWNRYGATRNLNLKLLKCNLLNPDVSPINVSVASGVMVTGKKQIGGICYPEVWGVSYGGQPTSGIFEAKDLNLYRTAGGLYITATVTHPIFGGSAAADTHKSIHYPGPSLILWHDSAGLFPQPIDPTAAIPATRTFGAIDIGSYNAMDSWTTSSTVTPTFRFYKIGSLSPTDLQTAIRTNRPRFAVAIEQMFYSASLRVDDAEVIADSASGGEQMGSSVLGIKSY